MTVKKRTISLLLTGSNQTIYTCPLHYEAEILSIIISNAAGASRTFSLDWHDSSETETHTLAEAVDLEANSLIQITDGLSLEQGDYIQGLASTTASVTVTIRVSEQFFPKQQ
jgi:hypothetical protein